MAKSSSRGKRARASVPSKRKARRASRRPKARAAVPQAAPASKLQPAPIGAKAAAPQGVGARAANTVLFIHGIGNKPMPSVLKCQWDRALFNIELGDRSRMAYWVNRDLYPEATNDTCGGGDRVTTEDDEATTRRIMAVAGEPGGEVRALANEIESITGNRERRAFLERMSAKMIARVEDEAPPDGPTKGTRDVEAKIVPLPGFLRRIITRTLTRAFLRDVHDFLFNAERRDRMEQSLLDRIAAGGGPFVVIAHSQGSLIAYDVLRRLSAADIEVPLFLTVGSPLGIQEVQDVMGQWTGGKLPFPACVKRWVNVADVLDPVAIDSDLTNDYGVRIENRRGMGLNPDSPRHPHSATGYLRSPEAQSAVREALGNTFQQAMAPFSIAKDLVADIEDNPPQKRHEVLIQLAVDRPGKPGARKDLDEVAKRVETEIARMVRAGKTAGDPKVDRLRHFVVAELTRLEVETLRSRFKDLQIDGLWRNAAKHALISASTHTVQAHPANFSYGADGANIGWAVLDTGIRGDHPHFREHKNIVAQWDCTGNGKPKELKPGSKESNELDKDGHGTHVAGVIAGDLTVLDEDGEKVRMAGMAPRCSLFGFKVLDDNGRGRDSWIIKALDTVTGINEAAGQLVIHGVNLSLGGPFDPSVFGCGHTPLCQELRRLWRQGVVVCLAAGNEGFAILRAAQGDDIQTNLDLSIGDPANLDEAIAVGSVHKTNPHTFGVSYFSSRGPTADGRRKPDVVAPGEKIISARFDWKAAATGNATVENHYVQMSGTSMATPHVSGLIAAFLSLRREFNGYPDRVKKMLLDGCVDLGRDPYMQGAGLPNLVKMLALN
jgi:subtilisin family serine protease